MELYQIIMYISHIKTTPILIIENIINIVYKYFLIKNQIILKSVLQITN